MEQELAAQGQELEMEQELAAQGQELEMEEDNNKTMFWLIGLSQIPVFIVC